MPTSISFNPSEYLSLLCHMRVTDLQIAQASSLPGKFIKGGAEESSTNEKAGGEDISSVNETND